MPTPAVDTAVATCGFGSWDLFFSIASPASVSAGLCTAANNPSYPPLSYPQFANVGANDAISGLQGVWSTTAASVSVTPSTGFDGRSWQNINNAKQDDGTYASIQPTSFNNARPNDCNAQGTEYLVLTGYNLGVPSGATILGFAAAVKGYFYRTTVQSGVTHYSYLDGVGVYNAGLILNGVKYLFADPSQDGWCNFSAAGQPPWPNDPFSLYVQGPFHFSQNFGWPKVIDNAWYPASDLTVPSTPTLVQTGIRPIVGGWNTVRAPLAMGTKTGCPPGSGHTTFLDNGPVEKTFNLTPTKSSWTDVEVNDPTFGVIISAETEAVSITGSIVRQDFGFIDCVGLGVYYTAPAGGGGTVGQRSRLWIST